MRLHFLWLGGIVVAALWGASMAAPVPPAAPPPAASTVLVDDFEAYTPGGLPTRWRYYDEKKEVVFVKPEHMRPDERFYVVEEAGNKFVRAYARGESVRIIMPTQEDQDLQWDLETHPKLRWDWRANRLPEGADETKNKLNDTGAAVYVVFSVNVFGPKAIKYTYSSTLPVGTVKSFNLGRLKVVVAASAADGIGQWMTIERDIAADYRRHFGGDPPRHPLSIMLWSDSDNTGLPAEADFDDIVLVN